MNLLMVLRSVMTLGNHDNRIDYTLFYNGVDFMGTTYRMSPDYEASAKERLDYSSEASKTGFMWRK